MKINLIFFSLFFLIVLSSCDKDQELDKSIFIADSDNPGLPIYSEYGLNTFGVLYDREPLINSELSLPSKVVCTEGKTSFYLRGHKGDPDYYYYNGSKDPMALIFDFGNFIPETVYSLTVLNDTVINLKDPLCNVTLMVDTAKFKLSVMSGTIHFKKAQKLFVDMAPYEVILSGTFEFQALVNGEPKNFSEGRFDVGIAPDNFYKY